MKKTAKKGFSLIEFMVALLITIILVGGFTMALNSITLGTRNATRSTDLTNLTRGVFKLMQSDFYKTWKSVSDLNLFQIHVAEDNGDNYFYGITDIGNSGVGVSDITLQWFDTHREWTDISGDTYNLPTFLSLSTWMLTDEAADPGAPVEPGLEWAATIPPLTLMSPLDVDPDLNGIAAGDYFLLYRADSFYNNDVYALENLFDNIDPTSGLYDEEALKNGAILLQVAGVQTGFPVPAEYGTNCDENLGFASAARVVFGGPTFNNVLTVVPGTNYSEITREGANKRCVGTALFNQKSPQPPEGAWMARKLGESGNAFESFNRVRYRLDKASDTLIRTQNGTDMIMASNVEYFDILIGMDVIATDEAWDGAVSMEDGTHWIRALGEIGVGGDFAKTLINRHALAVKIVITFKSVMQDMTDDNASETGDALKRRTFEQIIRLKNGHLPMGSL